MTIRDTSREAYQQHRSSGHLQAQEQRVLDHLGAHPGRAFTRAELAQETGIRLSAICGRVNALVKLGLVVEPYRRQCTVTGSNAWAVRAVPVQRELFERAA